ncbi:MAG TPA: YciI family protein [Gemmatimonadales bacterium]|jgi:uncharacterized protein YciI
MPHYFCRLIPPRPDFADTMSPEEGRLMQQHVAYWLQMMDRGRVIVFGPVADPRGNYGLAILSLEDGEDPQAVTTRDPTIEAGVGFSYEIAPMPRVVTRP